jgi:outer membrane receptor protein involved in Fe transport
MNGTIYYEDSKLSARVSGAYRSPFVVGGSGTGNVFEGTNESLYFDASISYKLTDFLTLSLEGINLTNEKQDRFADIASDRMLTLFGVGRTITAGVRIGF